MKIKKLLFVSTGRCGTKRIAQILQKHLPEEFTVVHQMPLSRLANIIGNICFFAGSCEHIKRLLYYRITSAYCRHKLFICTDPLTAMIIPREDVYSAEVCIVHITRDSHAFAESFFKLSRRRPASFIAHNLVPFWQVGLWPFENCLNPGIKKKYMKIAGLKNQYFKRTYSTNPNYCQVGMSRIFSSNFLSDIICDAFHYEIDIPAQELRVKAN